MVRAKQSGAALGARTLIGDAVAARIEVIRRVLLAAAVANGCMVTAANAEDETVNVAPVVVTPTRVEQSSFDLPVSVDAFDQQDIQTAQPEVNISEVLIKAPGVVANDRQNFTQDLQISIRGFGARAAFGVRGIRIIADGIPLTMPDGQSQAGNIDLGSAERVEVLRGPFSSLYGNSSGGVINVFTEDGPERPTVTGSAWVGDFGSSKYDLKLGGQQDRVNYIANVSRYDTDGYRDHSAATRDIFNTKIRMDVSDNTSVTVVANALNQPDSQDPGSLTKAQVEADPTQAAASSLLYNTRESVDNSQAGAVLEQRLSSSDTLRFAGYAGTRDVEGYLGFGGTPFTVGRGVVGLDRNFYGLDARWTRQTQLSGRPLTFTIGLNYDNMEERRKSWSNNFGIKGELGRDEDNTVFNFDQFAQAEWLLSDRWSVSGGLRHSVVKFESKDYFVTGTNPDDSGNIEYSDTTPVIGAVFKVTPVFNLYANYGQGFETPTYVELAYASSDGSVTGLNYDLKASTSDNYEIGAKAFLGAYTRVNAAVFLIDTKNEVAVFTNQRGRAVYQNIDGTTREGFELTVDSEFANGFTGLLTYSYIDATFDSAFGSCVGICSTPAGPNTLVPAGNKIPGIPANVVYGEVAWASGDGMFTAVEARWSDKVYVNDINDEFADAYTVVNWRLAFQQTFGGWGFTEFARVNNIFDEQYVGSVVLNDADRAYYEPSPGRNFIVGASASYAF